MWWDKVVQVVSPSIEFLMQQIDDSDLLKLIFSCFFAAIVILHVESMMSFLNHWQRADCSVDVDPSLDIRLTQHNRLSPINIVRSGMQKERWMRPLSWHYYDELPRAVMLTNNGTTVVMHIICEPNRTPYVMGGLSCTTITTSTTHSRCWHLIEVCFKWGALSSEHSIDLYRFALEMQVLHRSTSISSSSNNNNNNIDDGNDDEYLTISYLFALNEANGPLANITDNLRAIEMADSCIELPPFDLTALIQPIHQGYYSYMGTYADGHKELPTKWLICSSVFGLSTEQLRSFKSIRSHDNHNIVHNARPTQPLGNRLVRFHI